MKKYVAILSMGFLAVSCASNQVIQSTVERADDISSRPEWASLTKPMYEENGKKYFLGYVEVDSESSKSAALNMSDEKAISEPFRSIVDQFFDQNQVGEVLRGSTGQRIISSTRSFRPAITDLQIVKRYWELVESKSINGPVRSSLRVYSLAEVSIIELEKAKQRYLSNLSSNLNVKKVLDEVGARQREQALNQKNQGE